MCEINENSMGVCLCETSANVSGLRILFELVLPVRLLPSMHSASVRDTYTPSLGSVETMAVCIRAVQLIMSNRNVKSIR